MRGSKKTMKKGKGKAKAMPKNKMMAKIGKKKTMRKGKK